MPPKMRQRAAPSERGSPSLPPAPATRDQLSGGAMGRPDPVGIQPEIQVELPDGRPVNPREVEGVDEFALEQARQRQAGQGQPIPTDRA